MPETSAFLKTDEPADHIYLDGINGESLTTLELEQARCLFRTPLQNAAL